MKYLKATLFTLAFAVSAQAADLKIGVIDLQKTFAEYNKTKDAQAKLQENANKAKEEMNERVNSIKTLNEQAEKLSKEIQDPVMNEESRAKKRGEFQAKVNELRALERDIQEFRQRREQQLQSEGLQQRKGLYDEILQVVNEKAKAGNYDLVFDKSGVGAAGLPFLVHSKEGATEDFTAEVIVELNKGTAAPAEKK